MAIKVTRNATGNCINFVGSSQPAYWNACLSAQVNADDSTRIDVVNDIRTAGVGTKHYEFYAMPFADFQKDDGSAFVDITEAVAYINEKANVIGLSDTGLDMTGVDVNFRLDDTSTSVILDNGMAFGVGTIKALTHSDGTVHIHAIGIGKPNEAGAPNDLEHLEKLEVGRVYVDGVKVGGGTTTIVNTLNELFTVGPFGSVVITDPTPTTVADFGGVDVAGSLVGNAADPAGDDIAAGVESHFNKAGYKTTDLIDQPGEYFTFNMRNNGIFGAGLVLNDVNDAQGNATYADPTTFCDGVTNTADYGTQWGMLFNTITNGPWTYYGASTGTLAGDGWTGSTPFNGSNSGANWLAGNPEEFRIGIDANSFISMEYYDNDNSVWVIIARTTYTVAAGVKFHLGIKFCDSVVSLVDTPRAHLIVNAAPTMFFRYVESPDNNFEYPLFATEEEADYFDLNSGGGGTSHTHTYADDPTSTVWYMPDNGSTMSASAAPGVTSFMGNASAYTEITTLTNADLTPDAFTSNDYTELEGTVINIPLLDIGYTYTQGVSIVPTGSGLVYNTVTGYLQGTLNDVSADTVYTITVTRANTYGSTVGSFTITATDVPAQTPTSTPYTKAVVAMGNSEYLEQNSDSSWNTPMTDQNTTGAYSPAGLGGNTSAGATSYPWHVASVFEHVSGFNTYIACHGVQGGRALNYPETGIKVINDYFVFEMGMRDDYIRATSTTAVFAATGYYGIYVSYDGFRDSSVTAAQVDASHRFKLVDLTTGAVSDIDVTWQVVGTGAMTVGNGSKLTVGRPSQNIGDGLAKIKSASLVISTILPNTLLPDGNEISMIVRDPKQWLVDYKIGNPFRVAAQSTPITSGGVNIIFSIDNIYAGLGTQVWLMGDGGSDSYATGIRNEVHPASTFAGKLRILNMVSADIETVNINGLT